MKDLMRVLLVVLLFAPFVASAGDVEFIGFRDEARKNLPFSAAVRVGDLLFLSGEVGTRPGSLELVAGGIEAEARQTMENIRATLESQGLRMDQVVKCVVMLADIGEWQAFNAVYEEYFQGRYPARSAFAASGLALGARVEVECIAAASAD